MTNVIITAVLLLGNGLFVGGEFALIASRRTALEPLAATSKAARWALSAMNQIPLMIAGAQLGITICSLALGAIAEPALAHLLEGPFHAAGLPERAVHPVAFVLALLVVVFLHTVIGEMVPKNITLAGPERSALILGPFMLAFCTATKPLLVAMRWASRTVLKLWKIEATDAVKTVFTAEELAGMVTQARSEGLLGSEQYARIHAALGLSSRTAADTLLPWSRVTTVAADVSPATLEAVATRSGRSRFPVVQRDTRRVLGFVHVKDILGYAGAQRRLPIPAEVIRPLAVVSPERSLADLLLTMRRDRLHIVLVSDGRRPLGVITLDDVLHAVVGEPAGAGHPAGRR
ncbi:CBS domain containing-hemolysin-like protein [Actinoplanes octamycinicus]|uniref:CBS domain containing-hemolysin-like protein n=1 Tax=Actinoplanes octamycinicus TaxID=135948 RepID=A0A7W7GTU5_9ACTN|nr:hemolysin family protein [Actinoplanes octamycinicus]MBB4738186.1 CBS domain containing-hemolysin-like protein [Actinoplanes octamycinicus]GIE59256.1 membrane protein [Actinoplanes octamycinicus]